MARGDIAFDTIRVDEVEILNRKEFEAVSMTIDSASAVKAGTPIAKDGKPVKTTPWANCVGILLHDVDPKCPQGAVLKKAYVNKSRAEANAGVTYDSTLAGLCPMIVFE